MPEFPEPKQLAFGVQLGSKLGHFAVLSGVPLLSGQPNQRDLECDRQAHNPKVVGSNPAPATMSTARQNLKAPLPGGGCFGGRNATAGPASHCSLPMARLFRSNLRPQKISIDAIPAKGLAAKLMFDGDFSPARQFFQSREGQGRYFTPDPEFMQRENYQGLQAARPDDPDERASARQHPASEIPATRDTAIQLLRPGRRHYVLRARESRPNAPPPSINRVFPPGDTTNSESP